MNVYLYDKNTKEYLKTIIAYLDPVATKRTGENVYLQPEDSTFIEPIESKKNNAIIFDIEAQEWKYIKDYRGKTVYKTYYDSMVITELGPIPARIFIN